jgi:hypothetical protein
VGPDCAALPQRSGDMSQCRTIRVAVLQRVDGDCALVMLAVRDAVFLGSASGIRCLGALSW